MKDTQTTDLNVAEMLAQTFREIGVTHVYGVPGGGSNLILMESLAKNGIDFILTRTENAAVMMASASAEVTGSIGVAMTTKGPGVSNAINGVACSFLERSPVILITDGFNEKQRDVVTHQFIDQKAMLESITKHFTKLENPKDDIEHVVKIAKTNPCGPVCIELTSKKALELVKSDRLDFESSDELDIDPEALNRSIEMISKSSNPIVIVGLESREKSKKIQIRKLIDKSNYPVLTTYKGKGIIADEHPSYAGIFTGGKAESQIINESDLIIMIGVDPVEFVLQEWQYNIPIIDISVIPYPIHYFEPDIGLYGRIDKYLDLIINGETDFSSDWTTTKVKMLRDTMRQSLDCKGNNRMGPQDIIEVALKQAEQEKIKSDQSELPIITVDAGAHMFSAMAFWSCFEPYDVLISNGLSTMAYALPAAIAASINSSDRKVICFTGDGGLLMCLGEISTAVEQNLPIIIIVFNDQSLSLIDIKQQAAGMQSIGMRWGNQNFSEVMNGLGGQGIKVDDLDSFEHAMKNALQTSTPVLIDVLFDSEGYREQLQALRG